MHVLVTRTRKPLLLGLLLHLQLMMNLLLLLLLLFLLRGRLRWWRRVASIVLTRRHPTVFPRVRLCHHSRIQRTRLHHRLTQLQERHRVRRVVLRDDALGKLADRYVLGSDRFRVHVDVDHVGRVRLAVVFTDGRRPMIARWKKGRSLHVAAGRKRWLRSGLIDLMGDDRINQIRRGQRSVRR